MGQEKFRKDKYFTIKRADYKNCFREPTGNYVGVPRPAQSRKYLKNANNYELNIGVTALDEFRKISFIIHLGLLERRFAARLSTLDYD